jgi:autoinducer 2-degrading protein
MPTVSFIARMTVKAGRESEFLSLMGELAQHVRTNEPDTIGYEIFRLREPARFAVYESFRDEAAAQRHASSDALQRLVPRISDCLIGSWEIEHLDPV